jgi:hypothetical protein
MIEGVKKKTVFLQNSFQLFAQTTPYPIVATLCIVGVIHEIIKFARFSVDRLIGVGPVGS